MNTTILSSLVIIGLAAAAIGGGITGAWFSDTETSTDNTLAAGTLDLLVGVNGSNYTEPPGVLVNITDLKPGQPHYAFKKFRVSDNPANVFLHIANVSCDVSFINEPKCEALNGTWNGTDCIGAAPAPTDFGERVNYDLCVDPDNDYDCATEPSAGDIQVINFSDDRTLGLFEPKSNGNGNGQNGNNSNGNVSQIGGGLESCWIPLGQASPNRDIGIVQSFHLSEDTGNEYQGDVCTFTEEFMALQVNAPLPEPLCLGENESITEIDP